MQQEPDDQHAGDDQFFHETLVGRGDRFVDQITAVIAVTTLTPFGMEGSISLSLALTRSITVERILAEPHDDDAAHNLALAV